MAKIAVAHNQEHLSEDLFRRLVDESNVGMLVLMEGRFAYVNQKFCDLSGYSATELLLGKSPIDLVAGSDRALLEDTLQKGLSGALLTIERSFKGLKKDGSLIDVDVWGTRLQYGGKVALVASVVDVTARKQAEEESRFNLAMLASEQAASPDGILVVDLRGRMISFNRRFVDMWGIPAKVLAAGVDRDALRSVLDKVIDPDGLLGRVHWLYEHRDQAARDEIALKDGRTFVRYTAPMTDADDKHLGRVWFFHDVTERKRAEAARARFAAIVESSPDAISSSDLQGIVTSWNRGAEKLYGYGAAEMIGRSITALAPAERESEISELIASLNAGKTLAPFDTVRQGKDGRTVPVSISLSPIRDANGTIVGISAISRDITERKQAERAVLRLNQTLRVLTAVNETLVRARSEQELVLQMCETIVDRGGYRMAWIGFAESDPDKTVRSVAQAGHKGSHIEGVRVSWADTEWGRGPMGTAIRTGVPQVNQDTTTNTSVAPWREWALANGYLSSISLPLRAEEEVFGALTIYAGEAGIFDTEEVGVLNQLADDLSYGITALRTRAEKQKGVERLRHGMEAMVMALASTMEARDPYTAGHQRRVAELGRALARELGLPKDEVEGVHLTGIVHDIGKINTPSDILSKPGKLSKLEFEIVKGHAQAGYDILKGVEFPWPIAQIVLQHHERLDGSGYPQGLKEAEILIGARILAVADVVEAMMSHRPYRPARGFDAALTEIETGKGRLYDPAVVAACIELFQSRKFSFASTIDR